jgi:hypothetical protein
VSGVNGNQAHGSSNKPIITATAQFKMPRPGKVGLPRAVSYDECIALGVGGWTDLKDGMQAQWPAKL